MSQNPPIPRRHLSGDSLLGGLRYRRLLVTLVLAVPVVLFALSALADWLVWSRVFPVEAGDGTPALVGARVALVFLEAAAAWTALIVALFASVRYATRREPEALVVAVLMLATLPLDLGHLLGEWLWEENAAGAWTAFAASWSVSRLFQASSLALGSLLLAGWLHGRRVLHWTVGAIALLGALALLLNLLVLRGLDLAAMLPGSSTRSLDLVALALFALSATIYLRSGMTGASLLIQALLLMSLPLGLATIQVAALGGSPYDAHALGAHLLKLLAYSAALVGSLLDYFAMHRREIRAGDERLHAVRQELAEEVRERRRVEDSGKALQKAVETMSLGVTVIGFDGTIRYVNRADAEMHGYEVAELLGRDSRIFGGEVSGDDILMLSDRGYWERESFNVTRDGTRFPVRLLSDLVRNEAGEPIGLVTICEDLREQRRLRERLEEADAILEAMRFAAEQFLTAPDWQESVEAVLARLGAATQATGAYIAALENPPAPERAVIRYHVESSNDRRLGEGRARGRIAMREGLGALWGRQLSRGLIHVASAEAGSEEDRQVLEQLGAESCAVVPLFVESAWWGYLGLEAPTGPTQWSRPVLEALTTAARTFEAAIQRESVQQKLRASEERYRETVDGARETISSISTDGRIDWVNRAWRRLLGYSEVEEIEATWRDVVSEDRQPAFAEALEQVLAGGHVESLESTFLDKAGREIPVEGDLAPRLDAGVPVGAHGFFRDVTERRAVERMKEELLATVSHELRTPLTSIVAALDLIASAEFRSSSPERVQELISVAERNSNRLLLLINDLLDLQKIKAKQMKYRLEPVDVVSIIDQAVTEIRSFAASRDLEIEQLDCPQGARAIADRERLLQVLNNLLSNAIKYSTADSRKVTVGVSESGSSVRISVVDEGPGIPEEFLGRVFDEFTRADSSRTRRSGGSGLGLHIVRQLVQGMSGTVGVESRLGVGTAFHVDLPGAS